MLCFACFTRIIICREKQVAGSRASVAHLFVGSFVVCLPSAAAGATVISIARPRLDAAASGENGAKRTDPRERRTAASASGACSWLISTHSYRRIETSDHI